MNYYLKIQLKKAKSAKNVKFQVVLQGTMDLHLRFRLKTPDLFLVRGISRNSLFRGAGGFTILCAARVEQALRPALNLTFYHFNCAERVLKS